MDEKKTNDEAMDRPADAAAQEPASATDAGTPSEEAGEALRRENEELRDRLLRAAAEMDNLRKRTERELRDGAAYAISSFARDLLSVGDNMARAISAVSTEAREGGDAVLKALLDGVEMTDRELHRVLERHGVKRLEPQGERFDPHRHEAVFEVPDPSVPSGTVVQVMQTGYTIGERVLRPAMVGVSKGGPKPAPRQEPAADEAG